MDKGLFGWIYLLNPCGCPPISDDDPKECQQLISQRAGKSHYTSHNLHVLKEPFQTLHFTSCLKRFFFSPLSSPLSYQYFGHQCLGNECFNKVNVTFYVLCWWVGRTRALVHALCNMWAPTGSHMLPIHITKFQPCYGRDKDILRLKTYQVTPNVPIGFFFLLI